MKTRARTRRLPSALLAAAFALGTSVAIAQGKSGGADDAEPSQLTKACDAIGCSGGNRLCGATMWSQWVWLPTPWVPIPWLFTTGGTCYEPVPDR